MLKILGICFLALSLAHARNAENRTNGLLQFIAQHEYLRDFALGTVMGNRCFTYLPNWEARQCESGVKEMVSILDHDLVVTGKDQFVFLAFKTDTQNLLRSPRTLEFLKLVQKRLDQFLARETDHVPNLWELALSFYTEPLVAARVLATLFQDTSPMKLHLAYLSHTQFRGNSVTQDILVRLPQTIDTINTILDYYGDRSAALFYPKSVAARLNRTIYHFYVPLYLSLSLKARGLHAAALNAPMMMTLSYEFITFASDFRYVFKDPPKLENVQKLTDIYAGYLGAAMGARVTPMPFAVAQEGFRRSTLYGVGLLLL